MPLGDLGQRVMRFVELISGAAGTEPRASAPASSQAELLELVAIDKFIAIGRSKQVMDWAEFSERTDRWRRQGEFGYEADASMRPATSFFCCSTSATAAARTLSRSTTMTVFEFDSDAKLERVDLFQ